MKLLSLPINSMKKIFAILPSGNTLLCPGLDQASGQYYYYNSKYYDNDLIWEIGPSFGGMYSLADVGKKQYNAFFPRTARL